MATVSKPRKSTRRKVRTIILWDIYLIATDGRKRIFASDLDEQAKRVYLESVPGWHRSDERVEARPIVYRATTKAKAPPVESRPGKVICGPNGAVNLKELQAEDRQRRRDFANSVRDMKKGGAK